MLGVCVALLVGIGSLEIAQGFPTSSVTPSSWSGNTISSPSCVGGSTESNLTLVCSLKLQLEVLRKRYEKGDLAINPVWYGRVLNNTLTATDDCRLPFHKQLNVYNHLFVRVKNVYANRKFKRLTQRQITAIASLQDKLKESCTADGEDGCTEMNRDLVPAEASNAAIEAEEDSAHAWGFGLVKTLLKRLEPLDNGCSSDSSRRRRRRKRGERKDRPKKNRRRGGRKNRRQKKDKKADEKTKERSGKKGDRAARGEKRRRNRKSRVDDDNSTEMNNAITAATTDNNNNNDNDNNDEVVTDASEHAVGISTNDVEQVNIDVDNGKDSSSSDSDGKKKRRNRRRGRKNQDKRRDRKNRDKKRRKSKGRRNRRRKSSSS